jgi:glycosyltransferase involved in cell wall biosynthesis
VPQDGDGEIVVRNIATGVDWRASRGYRPPVPPPDDPGANIAEFQAEQARLMRPVFTADSKFVVFGIEPTARLAGYTDGEKGLATIDAALRKRSLCDQVEFHGRLAHTQVPGWLRAGRIGLVMLQAVPKFMKNIPSKMFEYWACGLPVLASDLPPIRQFLVEGENGYLFAPASAAQLAERITYLLSNPEQCRSLGSAGQRMVETQWNNDRQIAQLIDFYERLGAQGLRRRSAFASAKGTASLKDLPADLPER